jgi:hypothetical protein
MHATLVEIPTYSLKCSRIADYVERSENMLSPERVSTKPPTLAGATPAREPKNKLLNTMANINPNHESSQSQCNAILAYLQNGNAITGIEALRLFGCFRLPSRIHDLKQRGVKFTKKFITTDNGKRVMQYSLAQN